MPPIHSIVPRRTTLQPSHMGIGPSCSTNGTAKVILARTKSLVIGGVIILTHPHTWSIPVFRQENEQLQSSNESRIPCGNAKPFQVSGSCQKIEALMPLKPWPSLPSDWNPQRHRTKIMPRSTIRQIVKGHFTGNHDFSPSRKGGSYGGSP